MYKNEVKEQPKYIIQDKDNFEQLFTIISCNLKIKY